MRVQTLLRKALAMTDTLSYEITSLSLTDLDNPSTLEQLQALELVLSPGCSQLMTKEWLAHILSSGFCTMFVATLTGSNRIIGMSSFIISPQPHRGKGWLEDVAVLPEFGGHRVGTNLNYAVILEAQAHGFISKLDLTSSEGRSVAHKLYGRLGWILRPSLLMRLKPQEVSLDVNSLNRSALASAFPQVLDLPV